MTTQVNPTLSAVEQVFKDVIWTPLIMAGETALFTYAPILDAPVLGEIDKELISLGSDWLFNQFIIFVDVTTIKFKNSEAQTAYDSASIQLQIILHSEGIDSDAYQQALQSAVTAQIALTRVSQ